MLGLGGVGLSLISPHLAAIYGNDHRMYHVPNMFYTDEGLRMVLELLVGGIIFFCGLSGAISTTPRFNLLLEVVHRVHMSAPCCVCWVVLWPGMPSAHRCDTAAPQAQQRPRSRREEGG